jgi:hypothetical protein
LRAERPEAPLRVVVERDAVLPDLGVAARSVVARPATLRPPAAALAADVLEAAVLAVLAAAAFTLLPAASARPFDVFDLALELDLEPELDLALEFAVAPAVRVLVDLPASASLAPRLALEEGGALRFFAVFLLEGIRGYSLPLSRCGDGTGNHVAGRRDRALAIAAPPRIL